MSRQMDQDLMNTHLDYIERVAPELVAAFETIERIQKSDEWKRAYTYFHVMKKRGKIQQSPTKENGFKVILKESEE